MPTSRRPQALQAPSVLLLWIASSLFLAYKDWPSGTWGRYSPFSWLCSFSFGALAGKWRAHLPSL